MSRSSRNQAASTCEKKKVDVLNFLEIKRPSKPTSSKDVSLNVSPRETHNIKRNKADMFTSLVRNGNVKNLTKIFEDSPKNNHNHGMTRSRSWFNIQDEISNGENKKSFKETSYPQVLKTDKTKRKEVKSFSEVQTNDEIEMLRREISREMGSEYEKMRFDGFLDEFENIVSTKEYANERIETAEYNRVSFTYANFEEDFSESVIDLEDDPYVLECYNDDGNELVKLEISIQRTTINPNNISTLKREAQNSVIILLENGNEPIRQVDNFKELLNTYEEEPIGENETYNKFNNDENEYEEVFYNHGTFPVGRLVSNDNQGNIELEHVGYLEESNECEASESSSKSLMRNDSFPPSKK